MKYNVNDRGKNTKEYWENIHPTYSRRWKIDDKNVLIYIINNNWYHYVYVLKHILSDKHTFQYNKILDIGCAPNKCLVYFAEEYTDLEFIGIDFTDEILEFGKEFSHIKNLNFKKLDFLEEEITGCFDVITILETLEHVEEGTNYKLISDLLEKCKYLYVTVPTDEGSNDNEHISFYDFDSFDRFEVLEKALVGPKDNFIVNDVNDQDVLNRRDSNNYIYFFKLKGKL